MFATRKLVWILMACWMFTLASVTLGAPTQYAAHLDGTGDPRADGRAVWQADGGRVFLSVLVTDVTTTDVVSVHIDGEFIGLIEIQEDGVGMLEIGSAESDENVLVRPGTRITIYDALHANVQVPLLVGTFREG